MLTKAPGRSKLVEFCAEIGQTEPQAKTVDKKAVTFAVDTNDEMIQNKLKDSRIAMIKNKPKDSRFAMIEKESKDAKLRWMHTMD